MTDQPQFLALVDERFFREQSGFHCIALGYRPNNLDALPQISIAIFSAGYRTWYTERGVPVAQLDRAIAS